MNRYTIEQDGKRFVVEAEDEASALAAIQATSTQEQAGAPSLRFPTARSTVTGANPQEAQERGEAGMSGLRDDARSVMAAGARYGLPVAAGMAAAPFTAGMSLPASMALMSGVGGVSAGAGEFLAQSFDGEKNPDRILSAAVMGTTPFRPTGSVARRVAMNVPAAIASGELASFIEMGSDEYRQSWDNATGPAKRMTWPGAISGGLSLVGGAGGRAAAAGTRRAGIEIGRKGGSALISEYLPDLTSLEAAAIKRGNKKAVELYSNMDKAIGPEILDLFPEIPETSAMAARLRESVNRLNTLRDEHGAAMQASQKAQEAAQAMRQTNPAEAEKMTGIARKKAFEATQRELLYKEGLMKSFGGGVPDLGELAEGQRILSLQKISKDARESVRGSLDELYGAAGIGVNDAVAHVDDIMKGFDAIADDVARGEVQRSFASFIERTPEAIYDNGTLKLSAYRRLQADIADELTAKGKSPNYANKVAGEAYKAVKEASDGFIQNTMPDRFPTWQAANVAAAGEFAARKADAIDMLSKGNVAGLYQKIKTQGAGPVLNELQAYEQAIANSAVGGTAEAVQRAKEASVAFRSNYMRVIRDSAIDGAVDRSLGLQKDLQMIDPVKLSAELQSLSSKGFPIGELGLGSPARIQSLARIASAGNPRGLTVAQLDEFLREASTLGADKAAYRQAYFSEVRNSLLEQGAGRQGAANARVLRAARRAKADEATTRLAYQKAEADPLVQLLSDTSMKLSPDIVNNGKWVGRLLTLEPKVIRGFMDALETSGRGAVRDDIRKASAASVMRGMLTRTDDGRDVVNLRKMRDFFFSRETTHEIQRAAFEEIAGPEVYRKLRSGIAMPIHGIMEARFKLDGDGAMDLATLRHNMRAKATAGPTSAFFFFGDALNLIQAGRYNTAYLLHASPRFSRVYSMVGGKIDKFVSTNAVNAAALRYATLKDDEAKAASAQR